MQPFAYNTFVYRRQFHVLKHAVYNYHYISATSYYAIGLHDINSDLMHLIWIIFPVLRVLNDWDKCLFFSTNK